jgi:hypothetical protein
LSALRHHHRVGIPDNFFMTFDEDSALQGEIYRHRGNELQKMPRCRAK